MQNLNLDFSKSLAIDTETMAWVNSPAQGVKRKPLARAEQEKGHATSIVRYEPEASFERHLHPLGEEILVLEGLFSDENGDYGPGSYIRNPPGTGHAPFSKLGCTLFVKLHQFASQDNRQCVVDTQKTDWQSDQHDQLTMSLHRYENEHVMLIKCAGGKPLFMPKHEGGEELLILSGELTDERGHYSKGSWLRRPTSPQQMMAVSDTIVWLKLGHFVQ
jgi:anti-sigma factor ChrR (cupin superfamily)